MKTVFSSGGKIREAAGPRKTIRHAFAIPVAMGEVLHPFGRFHPGVQPGIGCETPKFAGSLGGEMAIPCSADAKTALFARKMGTNGTLLPKKRRLRLG